MIELSIIIVSYNTKKLTLAAVNSALSVDKSVSKEVIVIDNDSKDGSVDALKKLKKLGKIKLILNNKNTGFSFANNQGIDISTGKHVLLLNSDTVVTPGALKNLVDFAEENPDAGVVGSRLLNADGSLQPSCVRFPTIKNAILEYWFNKKGLFDKYAPKGKSVVTVDALVGASFLMTQKALKDVGKLNEKFYFYFEDIDYCRSVYKAGLKVYYLPTSVIYHYHGASGKNLADASNQWRRLIPSSKVYHGLLKHYLLTAVLWTGQKWQRLKGWV